MSADAALLRQYAPWELIPDGYPDAWHKPSAVTAAGHRVRSTMLGAEHRVDEQPPIKDVIREQAWHRCLRCGHPYRKGENERGEWSACDENCTHIGPIRYRFADEEWCDFGSVAEDGWRSPVAPALVERDAEVEAQWRILTVHHLDEDKANCRWWNLAALCQRCHLRLQRAVVMGRPYHYEHSPWFKPYAAGFYAWKYLGEDLSREQTMARLDELLALEHRFTQEALL